MTGRSAPTSFPGSPTACSPTWTSTVGRWSPPGRRASRTGPESPRPGVARLAATALLAAFVGGCAYLNTFYNAEQAYEEGVRIEAAAAAGPRIRSAGASAVGDSLSAAARAAFQRAAEKSAIVLARHSDSKYADDALLLLGKSLYRLGSYGDAAAAFRRYITTFPDGDDLAQARLGLVRSERRGGQLQAAEAALAPLLEAGEGVDRAEVLHEKGLIELEAGADRYAAATFRELLEGHPEFAREQSVALQFADAHLAAGEFAAALEGYAALRDRAGEPSVRREVGLRVARALALAGRRADAIATYDGIVAAGAGDSLAAWIHAQRGDLFAVDSAWGEAETAYARTAELAPGTALAGRATLSRGRIAWRVRDEREPALDILLDAFLHAPVSAWGDSARAEARALNRVLHYERLAGGRLTVAGLDDPALARSTALYRMAEEMLDAEADPVAAAAVFQRLAVEYPTSPWRPRALLAAGLLQRRNGANAAGEAPLQALIAAYSDTPEADSARRTLGLPVPDRAADFYAGSAELAGLAAALPDPEDPMLRIVDQLDRYAERRLDPLADQREGARPPARGAIGPGAPQGTSAGAGADTTDPGEDGTDLPPPGRPGIEP